MGDADVLVILQPRSRREAYAAMVIIHTSTLMITTMPMDTIMIMNLPALMTIRQWQPSMLPALG